MWCWRRMEKISWTDHVRNEEVLLRVNEQRNILHEIRKRKANWIGHILRRNCLLKQVIEGEIKGEMEVARRRRRRKKLLDDLNPFQPKLILVHTTVTGTCRPAYKTCKNWPLCSYVGWHQHSQPNAEKSAQCAKMTTGANGLKACILRTDEKHDAIWHHGAGKG